MSLLSRGLAAVSLILAISAVPSAARASAAQVSLFFPDVIVGEGAHFTYQHLLVGSSEPIRLNMVEVEIDWSGLADVASVAFSITGPGCSTSGTVTTCSFPGMSIGAPTSPIPSLVVRSHLGVPAGASGTWKATLSAYGFPAIVAEATVEVGEAVDLADPGDDVEVTSTPGGVFSQTLEVDNLGETAADGVVAVFYGDYAFVTTKQYSNCTYLDGEPRSCTFDEQLAPGGGYATSEAFPFKLREDTFAPGGETLEIEWMTKDDFVLYKQWLAALGQPGFAGVPGTGGKLTLAARPQSSADRKQTEIDPSDNFFRLHAEVEGDNEADLGAIGGGAAGSAGQVVTLDLGAKNHGPATRDHGRGLGFVTVDVTLPAGSSLAEMPRPCFAMTSIGESGQRDTWAGNLAARFIRCENPSTLLIAGEQVTFPVKLRIDQVVSSATGSVAILTDGCDGCMEDGNPANDTASILLNAPSLACLCRHAHPAVQPRAQTAEHSTI
jgi:hypothetical protein